MMIHNLNLNTAQYGKIVIYFSIFLITLVQIGCSEIEGSNPVEWEEVEHAQYNFSIEYPTKWNVELYGDEGWKGFKDDKLVILRRLSGLQDNPSTFGIIIQQREFENPSLQDALAWGNESIDRDLIQDGLQPKPGYEEFLFEEVEIDGYEAIRRRYSHFGMDTLISEEIYFPRENDMITILLRINKEYFDDFYPEFEQIVESFQTTR